MVASLHRPLCISHCLKYVMRERRNVHVSLAESSKCKRWNIFACECTRFDRCCEVVKFSRAQKYECSCSGKSNLRYFQEIKSSRVNQCCTMSNLVHILSFLSISHHGLRIFEILPNIPDTNQSLAIANQFHQRMIMIDRNQASIDNFFLFYRLTLNITFQLRTSDGFLSVGAILRVTRVLTLDL